MTMLSKDANHNVTMLREGHPVGGILEPETTTGWHRLMPSGNRAALVGEDKWKLNIGALRGDILDITDWCLNIYNEGYFQHRDIGAYENGIVSFTRELSHFAGLGTLRGALVSTNIEWAIYPRLVVPLGIIYRPTADTSQLTIGVTTEDVYDPTPRPFAVLRANEMIVMHTQRVQNIFYHAAAHDDDRILWGEHYIA